MARSYLALIGRRSAQELSSVPRIVSRNSNSGTELKAEDLQKSALLVVFKRLGC
jgi:hypothetical protein